MFSTGFNSGERDGSGSRVMLSGTFSFGRHVPSSLIDHHHGMGTGIDHQR